MQILKTLLLTVVFVFFTNLDASAQRCIICPPGDDGGGGIGGGGSGGGGGTSTVPTAEPASNITTQSFNAHWSDVSGASKYYLDVATNSSFSTMVSGYNNLEISGGLEGPNGGAQPPSMYSVFNITPGKDYYYRVRAQVNGTTSSNSNTIQTTTNISAPSKIEETSRTNTSFVARWGSVSGALAYQLDVATNSSFTNKLSNYNNKSVLGTSHTVSGLTPGKNYYYRVRAVGEDKTSSNSSAVTANTSISTPSKIGESNRTNTSFTARWGSVSGTQYYMLDVSTTSNFSGGMIHTNLNVGTATSKSITGLTPGKNYYYRVRAKGEHITSGYSLGVTANTSISPPSQIQESSNASNSFTAKWGGVVGAQSYRLDVSTTSNFSSMVSGYNNLNVGNVTNRSVTGLIPGKNYYYRVRAVGEHITSGNSSYVTANTTIPAPSQIQEISNTTTSFTARWGSVSGANSYRLDVSSVSNFSSILSGYNNLNVGTATSKSVGGLTPGIKYYYRVRAVGADYTSGNSSYVEAHTTIEAPAVIQETNQASTSFTANWGSVSGAQSYRLDVASNSNFSTILSGYNNLYAGGTSMSVNGLSPGKNYYYRVRAVGEDITSVTSFTITANTTINTPVTLDGTNITQTSFQANWNAVSGANTYSLQVSDVSDFSTIIQDVSTSGTTLTINNLTYSNTYYYRVKATGDAVESAYSSAETVLPLLTTPNITYTGGIVCSGSDPGQISGNAAVGGDGNYTYRWRYYNGTSWVTFSDNTNSANFNTSMTISADLTVMRQVQSAGSDWVSSNQLVIPIQPVEPNPGTLSMAAGSYCPGDDVSFSFSGTNSNVDLNNTFLEVLRRGVWVNLGNIQTSKSSIVEDGDAYRVRYEQLCSSSVYSNTITPSLRTDCIEPPSLDKNFVRVEIPRTPIADASLFSTLSETEKAVNYSYTDGAGRPTMTISASAAQNGEDVVQHFVYDGAGRRSTSYMPYITPAVISGEHRTDPATEQTDFYTNQTDIANDTHPFSIKEYDNYGRVKNIMSPGQAWHSANKNARMNYFMYQASMNGTLDEVKRWVLGTNDAPEIQSVYGNNLLSIREVISPDGRKSQTISNALGLPVATRKWDGSAWNTTYNVYDKYGRLRYVIPPKMVNKISLTDLEINGFLFEQKYDSRGRVTESRAPGAGWNYVVYDQWNRPVMSRHDAQKDANGNNIWSFVKYDIFGRTVMTGVVVSDSTRSGLQTMVTGGRYEDIAADAVGYTINQSFPDLTQADFDDYELHSINYYDNYDFLTYAGWDAEGRNFSPSTPAGFAVIDTTAAVLGITTASKVRVLGTNQWLNSVVYYDNKLRAIQLISENHLGGTDRLSYEMDWEGKVLQSLMDHQGAESVTVLSEYEYDARGQHIQTFETIDGLNRTLVAEYNYNVLGQMMEKNIHSTDNGNSFLQSVDYRYNIRGWLSSINDSGLSDNSETNSDLFGQELNYTNAATINGQAVAPSYDGNITSTVWNSDNSPLDGGATGVSGEAIYGYTYTPLNQLQAADYATKTGSTWTGDAAMYSMNAAYDANGNTQTLTRNTDGGALDDLSYTYDTNSNKLEAVADNSSNDGGMEDYYPGATDYGYDAMGNRTSDMNKQITNIRYNHLQMVDRIEFYDNTTINFTYTGTGGKLSKEIKDEAGKSIAKVDYVGTVEYLGDEINQVFIEGGRAYKQNGAYFNEYFITDNQGNNRVAFGMLPDRFIYTATMEQSRSAYEESEFSFPANIRSAVQNHTPLGSESVALNGTVAGKEVGPAKVLNITAGDEVDMQAWTRYDFTAWNNTSVANIASIVSSAFGGASAGTGGESASTALSNALGDPAASGLFTGNASGEPEAYLQYMFFDANHAYVADGSGFIAVGADAEGAFAKLESGTLTYNEPGYLFIYVVNESNQNADVFFDDLKITHSSSSADFKVSQVNEYYPYGLHTDKSWRHEGYVDPGMMYQAAYAGYDSLTGYYDFLYRSYDPALGQFFAVDPMAGTQTGYSPYHANYNNPVMYVDPLGLYPDYWPRHDSNPSSGGGSPDPGNWVSVGLGSSFGGGQGYGAPGSGEHWADGIFREDWHARHGSNSFRNDVALTKSSGGFQVGGKFYDKNGTQIETDKYGEPYVVLPNGEKVPAREIVAYDPTNQNKAHRKAAEEALKRKVNKSKNGWSVTMNNTVALLGIPATALSDKGYWVGKLKSGELRVYSPKFNGSQHVTKTGLINKWGAAGLTISILVDATNIQSREDLGSFGQNAAISTGLFLAPTPYTVGYLLITNADAIDAAYNAVINSAAQQPAVQRSVKQAKDLSSWTGFDWSLFDYWESK